VAETTLTGSAPAPPVRTSPARARLEVAVVGLAALLASLTGSLLIPVLPLLPERLDTTTAATDWLLTSTLLVGAVAVPLAGRLGDLYGRRRVLLVCIALLTAGSVIGSVTDHVALLILARSIMGFSSAAIPLGISLLSSLLPSERRGTAVAVISAMLGAGGSLGLPLGGLIGEHAGVQVLFLITAIGGVLTYVAIAALVPEAPERSPGSVDLPGAVVLAAGLVLLLLPLSQATTWGWSSPWTLGLLVGSVVVLGGFVGLQLRRRFPLVDVRATLRRPVLLTNLASSLFAFAMFASFVGTASYVQAPESSGYGFGSSILVSGLCVLPSGLFMLLLAPVGARLTVAIGAHRTLAIGGLVVAAGWLLRIGATTWLWEIVLGVTVVGIGTSFAYAAMPTLISEHTPSADLAAANGLNALARQVGMGLASATGGSLLTLSTLSAGGVEVPTLGAFRGLFALCAAAALLASVAAMAIPERRGAALHQA
jgi:MFS family permease